jgi:hypothetical protein
MVATHHKINDRIDEITYPELRTSVTAPKLKNGYPVPICGRTYPGALFNIAVKKAIMKAELTASIAEDRAYKSTVEFLFVLNQEKNFCARVPIITMAVI